MFSILRNIFALIVGLIFILFASCVAILIVLITWDPMKGADVVKPLFGKATLWLLGIKLQVEGRENLTKRQPTVFVGNHQSLLDIFIFPAILPHKTFAIGKKEVFRYPILGWMIRFTGQIPVDRSNHIKAMQSMQRVYDKVQKYYYSAFFCPEGTRSKDGTLLPFKKGAFHLALQTKIPVVPIVVFNAHKFMKKGSLRIHPGTLKIKVLPPVETRDWTRENLDQKIAEVRGLFLKELGKMATSSP